jgi:hypothetical protein
VADDAFKAMVLARIVQPTLKVAAIELLEELGVQGPHRNTLAAALKHQAGLPQHPREGVPGPFRVGAGGAGVAGAP